MNVPAKKMSVENHLALDRGADVKHEYVDGLAHAMAGASSTAPSRGM
jgi:hypothetical protein